MSRQTPRIISFVPSWTETLLFCGVNVIGRTRFCIHPENLIKDIPVVGGTKNADWEKIKSLNPDFVLMDREENTLAMADACPFPLISTHVESMGDMPRELSTLATQLNAPELQNLAERWQKILTSKGLILSEPPALLEKIRSSGEKNDLNVYVIWRKPWMAAGSNTFIGSVCAFLGWPIWDGLKKYPEFNLSDFKGKKVHFLCSSEPFPFTKKKEMALELPGDVSIVNGESLSWFGIRSLEYLETVIKKRT